MHPSLLDDIIFKIVFGTRQNEAVLRALLNALLGLTGPNRIVELTVLNPTIDKAYLSERGAVLDVKARDGRGWHYNIEVQVSDNPGYIKRSLFYLARLYTEQLEKGQPYDRLERTIAISLVDYVLFPDLADLHSMYRFYDQVHQRELSDVLEIHYLELVKFRGEKLHGLRTPFEKWLHVLKFAKLYESDKEPLPELLQEEEGIPMALDAMRKAYATDEVKELIEFRDKAMHDEATRMAHAVREAVRDAVREARQEATQEARKESALEIARKMLAKGMDRDTVLSVTGLRPEELTES